jgi:hypothetical protein
MRPSAAKIHRYCPHIRRTLFLIRGQTPKTKIDRTSTKPTRNLDKKGFSDSLVGRRMLSCEDTASVAIPLIAIAGLCWALPIYYRKFEVARADLRDDPQSKKEILLPAIVARAPVIGRYFLIAGLLVGCLAIFLVVKENAF